MTSPKLDSYWITFRGNIGACVDATSEAQAAVYGAELRGLIVTRVQRLPNPANPRLNFLVPGPAYCRTPGECANAGYCSARHDCAS
jgi:hypothetical protein